MQHEITEDERVVQARAGMQNAVELSAAAQRIFQNKDGVLFLAHLKKQAKGFDKDPYQHAYNAGLSRIVAIIEDAMNDSKMKEFEENIKELDEWKTKQTQP